MKHTPFTRSIPTDMLCKTHQNAEILDRLEYTAIHQKFTLLVGEPGTGKTSTLRHLKDRLPEDKYMVIYISDSRLKPRSFYYYTLGMFGCKASIHTSIEIMRSMQNRKVVVIIDEAHLLDKEMLEEARFLLNYRMDSENPVSLILSGQTELWDKLKLSAYRAILGRIDIECFLTPMDFSDTKKYIESQLTCSGHTAPIFTDDYAVYL